MFGVNRPGVWVAFGLSVLFHVTGFELTKTLPRESLASSPPSVKPLLRLIQKQQPPPFVKNLAQVAISKPKAHLAEASTLPSSLPFQNNEAEQTNTKLAALISESIFFKPTHYFESNEVDNNSELLEEWVIRTQGVQSTAIVAIRLILYINENGNLDKFVVLNSSLSESETDLLLKDFALTPFKPALKDERPVPSQKNVEILLDPNPAVFRIPNFLNKSLPTHK